MKALYKYKDWVTEMESFDDNEVIPVEKVFMGATICPEPSCAKGKYEQRGVRGPWFSQGADGEPTTIAVPCEAHADFEFTPGWYDRLCNGYEVLHSRHSKVGICRFCNVEFTEYLMGWSSRERCVECTYQMIQRYKETGRIEDL